MEAFFKKALGSRKFVLTVAGVIAVVLNRGLDLGIDETVVDNVVVLIVSYVIGESGADALGALGSAIKNLFGKEDDA